MQTLTPAYYRAVSEWPKVSGWVSFVVSDASAVVDQVVDRTSYRPQMTTKLQAMIATLAVLSTLLPLNSADGVAIHFD